MASMGKFRSAFNGFNRQDVANYIEYVCNRHTTETAQLQEQLDRRQEEIGRLNMQLRQYAEQINALNSELGTLRVQASEVQAAPAAPMQEYAATDEELEAYRRAERTERMANERAEKICQKADAILADAAAKADASATRVDEAVEAVIAQLKTCQETVRENSRCFRGTADALQRLNTEE